MLMASVMALFYTPRDGIGDGYNKFRRAITDAISMPSACHHRSGEDPSKHRDLLSRAITYAITTPSLTSKMLGNGSIIFFITRETPMPSRRHQQP
jgi:hypothetical protein